MVIIVKLFVISFDDGTVHDLKFIELLNKYNISASLNLNSGLEYFVWYNNGIPIERLKLSEYKDFFEKHEVCSHSLTHPYLTSLSKEKLSYEINQDVYNLESIFKRKVCSFAVPFTECNEREIDIIKRNTKIENIRLSCYADDYSFPSDSYHFKISALYNDLDVYEKIDTFNQLEEGIFILCGHSYEFYINDEWDKIEDILKYIIALPEIEIVTLSEASKRIFK